ncbi:hypothetical protein HK405_009533, partial [Cladochytrium tenue]
FIFFHRPPFRLYILTSDRDFSKLLHSLDSFGYHVTLVHNAQAAESLRLAARESYYWTDVLGFAAPPPPPPTPTPLLDPAFSFSPSPAPPYPRQSPLPDAASPWHGSAAGGDPPGGGGGFQRRRGSALLLRQRLAAGWSGDSAGAGEMRPAYTVAWDSGIEASAEPASAASAAAATTSRTDRFAPLVEVIEAFGEPSGDEPGDDDGGGGGGGVAAGFLRKLLASVVDDLAGGDVDSYLREAVELGVVEVRAGANGRPARVFVVGAAAACRQVAATDSPRPRRRPP